MDNNYYPESFRRKTHYYKAEKQTNRPELYEHYTERMKKLRKLFSFIYFPLAVLWMELTVKLSSGFSIAGGLLYTALFTIPLACVLSIVCTLFKSEKVNRRIAIGVMTFLAIWYTVQLIYNNVFGTLLVMNSITNGGATQAANSVDMIFTAIKSRFLFMLLTFVPVMALIFIGKRFISFGRARLRVKLILLAIAVVLQITGVLLVGLDKSSADAKSNYNLYYGELQQNAVCERFGLFTMQRLDITRSIFGSRSEIKEITEPEPQTVPQETVPNVKVEPQIIETDFKALSGATDNEELKSLYSYFESATPTNTNEYTGMFKDYNVIFLTAESFSQYAIDKELTPTLYRLYNEGFQFENYYVPAWGVSTTDGEYANLTGLIPKSGVWSFSRSAENKVSFPFSLGMQARAKGVEEVRAYHNHTYDYYDRDKYLTNIGYDYSAIGMGLDLGEDVWPNSDLKMMQKTVGDYINADSFSVYYMTVSGHGGYSYNTISIRNAELVEHLNYSDEVKGYIAANIELDRAVEYLIAELERAGKLDKTVICLTADHYPYALDEFNGLDELAGHKVDTTFERYKNSWLLWSGSMEEPVRVETQCSSLDILPTMLNLLGLEYDSRTLMGTDVFSGKAPFVVFGDRSWISQNGRYNANTGEYTEFENAQGKDDLDVLQSKCTNMFTVSRMILDNNAYATMYGDD